jgi:hypothetical protein
MGFNEALGIPTSGVPLCEWADDGQSCLSALNWRYNQERPKLLLVSTRSIGAMVEL